jgi:hypothetical protein
MKGKLAPRYVGPFEILEACGPVAYHLQLPPQLAAIHNIFHISQLRKCVKIPTEVINFQTIKILRAPTTQSQCLCGEEQVEATDATPADGTSKCLTSHG